MKELYIDAINKLCELAKNHAKGSEEYNRLKNCALLFRGYLLKEYNLSK